MKKAAKKELQPKVKLLEVNFADMKVGQTMAIGTPQLILELTRKIPAGECWTIKDLRRALAQMLKADVACPVTTAMFLRRGIEETVALGVGEDTPPFWRAVEVGSALFKKLSAPAQAVILKHLLTD